MYIQVERAGGNDQQEAHSRSPEERHLRDDGGGSERRGCRSALCHAQIAEELRQGSNFICYGIRTQGSR